jgi:hypothetical protein
MENLSLVNSRAATFSALRGDVAEVFADFEGPVSGRSVDSISSWERFIYEWEMFEETS